MEETLSLHVNVLCASRRYAPRVVKSHGIKWITVRVEMGHVDFGLNP